MSTFLKAFGNLTIVATPELKTSAKGNPFTKFNAVHNDTVYNNGEVTENAIFIRCVVFGKDAEYIGSKVNKGARIGVTGSPKVGVWKDKNTGEPRGGFELNVESIKVLYNPKKDAEVSNRTNPKVSTYKKKEASFADDIADDNAMSDQDASWGDDDNDSIPF